MINKLYSPPQSDIPGALAPPGSHNLVQHWTLLLLAPDHFFNENNLSFPTYSQTPQRVETMSHSFGRLHSVGAEMNLIAQGLGKISERWAGRCLRSSFLPFPDLLHLVVLHSWFGKGIIQSYKIRYSRSQAVTLQ